ncbi:hypothetical protein KAH27_08580, partial [bacterium]|nr:hypothetical protein [bacterium]
NKSLPKADIEMIIESRVDELIQFIKSDVADKGFYSLIGSGIVFVGGSTHLYHFKDKTRNYFGKPVRVATPLLNMPDVSTSDLNIYSDRHEFLRDPSCATILGLLKSGYNLRLAELKKSTSFFDKIFRH